MFRMIISVTERRRRKSCSPVSLGPIDKLKYREFAISLFRRNKKDLSADCFDMVYDYFCGHTWYVQYVLNRLFEMTAETETAGREMVGEAIDHILGVFNVTYQNILSNYSERQRALLIAVAKERRVQGILSGAFIKKYRLNSASSVQGALKALLDNETIVRDGETYRVDNHFFFYMVVEEVKKAKCHIENAPNATSKYGQMPHWKVK